LRLVVSPPDALGGSLLARLPLITLAGGLVITAAAATLTQRLQRRRAIAEALAAENAELYAEQRSGSIMLQQSLLPRSLPTLGAVDVAVAYRAGEHDTEVGGDWYDVIDRGDVVVVVVGDVSGRGLAAASAMATTRHTIKTLVGMGLPLGEVLSEANRLAEIERDGHFATVLVGAVDVASRSASFASAGHPPPILVDGSAGPVTVPVGPPIGVAGPARFDTTQVPLPASGALLLFTDGVFERRGEAIDVGIARLADAARDLAPPLQRPIDGLLEAMTAGTGADDALIVALGWRA